MRKTSLILNLIKASPEQEGAKKAYRELLDYAKQLEKEDKKVRGNSLREDLEEIIIN